MYEFHVIVCAIFVWLFILWFRRYILNDDTEQYIKIIEQQEDRKTNNDLMD